MTEDFEREIASVAHRMTGADPPMSFRARVVGQLEPRRRPHRIWIVGPLTVCAAAVIVTAIARRTPTAPSIPARIQRTATVEPRAATHPESASHAGAGSPAPAKPTQTRRAAAEPTAEETAWRARAVPVLSAPAALTMAPIQPEWLEIRPLVTTPLSVPAIGDDEDRP